MTKARRHGVLAGVGLGPYQTVLIRLGEVPVEVREKGHIHTYIGTAVLGFECQLQGAGVREAGAD